MSSAACGRAVFLVCCLLSSLRTHLVSRSSASIFFLATSPDSADSLRSSSAALVSASDTRTSLSETALCFSKTCRSFSDASSSLWETSASLREISSSLREVCFSLRETRRSLLANALAFPARSRSWAKRASRRLVVGHIDSRQQ